MEFLIYLSSVLIGPQEAAEDKGPTSGLEPLTCSLRVITQALQGFARGCKTRISRRLSLLRFAVYCTVLRSRWCQSGVNKGIPGSRSRWLVASTRMACNTLPGMPRSN